MTAEGATLTIRAEIAKNRTEARLPLAGDLAHDLAPFLQGKLPTASLLALPPRFKDHAPRWLRLDLARAKIPYADAAGRACDVRALRSSFVASLVRSGANVRAVQLLARHSSPTMTLGVYARLDGRDEREAIECAPNLSPALSATGTDGWTAEGTGSDSARCGSARPDARANPQETTEIRAGAHTVERLKGLEPSTSTLARWRSTTELQPRPSRTGRRG